MFSSCKHQQQQQIFILLQIKQDFGAKSKRERERK
jgi:hypothetical protein